MTQLDLTKLLHTYSDYSVGYLRQRVTKYCQSYKTLKSEMALLKIN